MYFSDKIEKMAKNFMQNKKRIILSLIFTLIVLFATNKYWIFFKDMPISLYIKGQGKCKIEIQLNKKNDNKFHKIKNDDQNIKLDTTDKINFNLKRARTPKRIRIIIYNAKPNTTYTISKIDLNNGKFIIDDFTNIKVEGAKLTKNGKTLKIKTQQYVKNVIITYPEKLNIKAESYFDFKLFIIITILSYLLIYRLINYLADFNTVKDKPLTEVLFLVIFFIFLFIPMIYINDDDISKSENRTLAKWKPFIFENNKINFDFGNNFNEWFNDRFYLREFFIDTYDKRLIFQKNWITKVVVKGKNNWLFLGTRDSIESYTNSVLFTEKELEKITTYLKDVDYYCKKHNKKFYFLITPDKARIYGEYYSDRIKSISNNTRTDQLIQYLNKNSDIEIIYPKNRLLSEKKNNLIYYKQDSHWTPLAAYYAYQELMNTISIENKNIKTYSVTKYKNSQIVGGITKLTPKILRTEDKTLYVIPDIQNNATCQEEGLKRGLVTCFDKQNTKNLVMYRDSFASALIPYLANTFKISTYLWKYSIFKNEISDADIVILEIVERLLPTLLNSEFGD